MNRIATGSALPVDQRRRLSESASTGIPPQWSVMALAQIALIARYGAAWFRGSGTAADPGTRLLSVTGPDPVRDVVLEVPGGAKLTDVLQSAGMDPATLSPSAGRGYHGRWVRPESYVISPGEVAGHTVRPGAGVIHALGTVHLRGCRPQPRSSLTSPGNPPNSADPACSGCRQWRRYSTGSPPERNSDRANWTASPSLFPGGGPAGTPTEQPGWSAARWRSLPMTSGHT